MNTEQLKRDLLHKTSKNIDDTIRFANAITGESDYLYTRIKASIKRAESIDIIVSFLMESGVKLLLKDLQDAIARGVQIRLLTGNYLHITEPSALYLIREALGDKLDLRLYNVPNKSFHPKAYLFHGKVDSEIYIGSSNISRGALTRSVEWNYRFTKSSNEADFNHFYHTFEDLFEHHAIVVTDEVLTDYSKRWTKPRLFSKEQSGLDEMQEAQTILDGDKREVIPLYEPRGAQIEALYALKHTREEGWDRGIVVAATGIGKTYLAAFDSRGYKRTLFVAHREEILKQAAESFKKIRPKDEEGFFYNSRKDTDKEMTFALVQTLGKKGYLQEEYFKPDAFDYIVIDECHHATAKNYEAIRNYFKPKFWLFLTATPTRMDNADIFELAHYNTVYEVTLQEAINKDFLVPFRYYGVYDDTINYEEIAYKNGKYEQNSLDARLMVEKRADLVLKHYLKYGSKCAMGFCSSKAHAEYMAQYFNNHGVKAVAVYSGDQGAMSMERSEALNKLTKGELQVIFSVDMFNEGVDVPSIDMVLFLRPTESPIVFLQQLGRGLRKFKGKDYLTILDFIGNYRKANMMPFLLGMKTYTEREMRKLNPQNISLPEGCLVDFDFRLIDLFKEMGKKQRDLRACIVDEYESIREESSIRPTRMQLYTHMEQEIYSRMKSKSKENVLNDYLTFIKEMGDMTKDEESLLASRAADFIRCIETTDMSRTYKMPLLLAFYNKGNVKLAITDREAVESFKAFYEIGANNRDLMQDKSNREYQSWDDKKWLRLIKNNPAKFLLKSSSDFFKEKEGYLLALDDSLAPFIENEAFKEHFKDVIDYRVTRYYRERFKKEKEKL